MESDDESSFEDIGALAEAVETDLSEFGDFQIYVSEVDDDDDDDIAAQTLSAIAAADVSEVMSEGLKAWVHAIAIVNFDLDVGPKIQTLYPLHVQLSADEETNVRFSSLPDAGGLQAEDSVFSFRCPASSSGFLYGYVFFRQRKDSQLRRGFLQKSVVILSHLPLPGLFLRAAALMGRAYFDSNKESQNMSDLDFLEFACSSISSWPAPSTGQIIDLPFFGLLLQVDISNLQKAGILNGSSHLLETSGFVNKNKLQRRISANRNGAFKGMSMPTPSPLSPKPYVIVASEQILPHIPCSILYPRGFLAFHPGDSKMSIGIPADVLEATGLFDNEQELCGSSLGILYRFFDVLEHLWVLWELVLLGHPIALMGKSQSAVSESAWWLSNLIRPIPFCGDFRPYLTIQDTEFKSYTQLFKDSPEKSDGMHNFSANVSTTSLYMQNTASSRSAIFRNTMAMPPSPTKTSSPGFPRPLSSSAVSVLLSDSLTLTALKWKHCLVDAWGNQTKSTLVGVTNPFFIRSFSRWPHVLKFADRKEEKKDPHGTRPRSSQSMSINGTSSRGQSPTMFGSMPKSSSSGSIHSRNVTPEPSIDIRSGSPIKSNKSSPVKKVTSSIDYETGFTSSYKPFLTKDKKFIKALREAYYNCTAHIEETHPTDSKKDLVASIQSFFSSSPNLKSQPTRGSTNDRTTMPRKYKGYALNEIVRRHFVDLSDRFLVPLNRYFATLIPQPPACGGSNNLSTILDEDKQAIHFASPPNITSFKVRPFDTKMFIAHLNEFGPPHLPFKHSSAPSALRMNVNGIKNWTDMYARFVESPHFIGWLRERKAVTEKQIRQNYQEALQSFIGTVENSLSVFLTIRRELYWAGFDKDLWSSKLSIRLNPRSNDDVFHVLTLEQGAGFTEKALRLWDKLPANVQESFKAGKFDHLLPPLPDGSEDFILVVSLNTE